MEKLLTHYSEGFFIDRDVNGYHLYCGGKAWINEWTDGLELDCLDFSTFEVYPAFVGDEEPEYYERQITDKKIIEEQKEYLEQNYWDEIFYPAEREQKEFLERALLY